MRDELDELLGIDDKDPIQQLAGALVNADARLRRMLVSRRRRMGLSQEEVGRRMGVTQPAVHAFERADADPKLSTIRRYALAVHALVTHSVDDGVPSSTLAVYPDHVLARSNIEAAGAPGSRTTSGVFVQAPAMVAAR